MRPPVAPSRSRRAVAASAARGACLALVLGAAACAGTPPSAGPPAPAGAATAVLPPDAVLGIGDPTRAAIIGSAYAFGAPAAVFAGRPDRAARAAAEVEYLATELPTGPRWVQYSPTIGMELVAARAELRTLLGIAPEAPPQAVVDALYAAARALQAGDREAAEQALVRGRVAPDGRGVLTRLAAMPAAALPRTATATALAQQEMNRVDQDDRFGGAGGNDGGKV